MNISEHAEVSRPGEDWKLTQNGQRGGAKQSKYKYTNWYHPFLWIHIDEAAKKVGWSVQAIANGLQLDHPCLFG